MAKIQFNCRLEEEMVEKINAEVKRLTKLHGSKVSQGDVIELRFAGPIEQSSKKLSKREQKIAAIRAQDPMADQRPDIDYGSEEVPSGGSVITHGAAPRLGTPRTGKPDAYRARGMRPKPDYILDERA